MWSVCRRRSEPSTASRMCSGRLSQAGDHLLAVLDAEAELRGEDHLVAPPLERPAQQLLVGVGAVDLRRVEEGAAELDGAVDGGDGFRLVRGAVRLAHAHAAKADGRDLKALLAEFSFFKTHIIISFCFCACDDSRDPGGYR